jgi:hypothetical protein
VAGNFSLFADFTVSGEQLPPAAPEAVSGLGPEVLSGLVGVLSVGCWVSNVGWSVGVPPYIECVFENGLAELDAAGTLAAAEANEHVMVTAETRRLADRGAWGRPAPR